MPTGQRDLFSNQRWRMRASEGEHVRKSTLD